MTNNTDGLRTQLKQQWLAVLLCAVPVMLAAVLGFASPASAATLNLNGTGPGIQSISSYPNNAMWVNVPTEYNVVPQGAGSSNIPGQVVNTTTSYRTVSTPIYGTVWQNQLVPHQVITGYNTKQVPIYGQVSHQGQRWVNSGYWYTHRWWAETGYWYTHRWWATTGYWASGQTWVNSGYWYTHWWWAETGYWYNETYQQPYQFWYLVPPHWSWNGPWWDPMGYYQGSYWTFYWASRTVNYREWISTAHWASDQWWISTAHEQYYSYWVSTAHWASDQQWISTAHWASDQQWISTAHWQTYTYWTTGIIGYSTVNTTPIYGTAYSWQLVPTWGVIGYSTSQVPVVTKTTDSNINLSNKSLIGVQPEVKNTTTGQIVDGSFCTTPTTPLMAPTSPGFPDYSGSPWQYSGFFSGQGICNINVGILPTTTFDKWAVAQQSVQLVLIPSWTATVTYNKVTTVNGSVTSSVPVTKVETVTGAPYTGPTMPTKYIVGVVCAVQNGQPYCPNSSGN